MSVDTLTTLYRWMVLLREIDRRLASAPYFHAAIGEEAVPVGTFHGLRPSDRVAPQYRGAEVVQAMRGTPLPAVLGGFLGTTAGWSRGKSLAVGGDPQRGFVPWITGGIGSHIGIATGHALAMQLRGTDDVVVCSFGDGAVHTSSFHGALNLAALHGLPIVYVCQNNGFQLSLAVSQGHANPELWQRAVGYGLPGSQVDGNDVLAVHDAVSNAVAAARGGEGPSFIEARTYRLHGHVEVDPADYRDDDEVTAWASRDPIDRARDALAAAGASDQLAEIDAEVSAEVAEAYEAALAAPPLTEEHVEPHKVLA